MVMGAVRFDPINGRMLYWDSEQNCLAVPSDAVEFLRFLSRNPTIADMGDWARANGEVPEELLSVAKEAGFVRVIEGGDPRRVVDQISAVVVVPASPAVETVDGLVVAGNDGSQIRVAAATQAWLWADGDRVPLADQLGDLADDYSAWLSYVNEILTDLDALRSAQAVTFFPRT